MTRRDERIRMTITAALTPAVLEVVNESSGHNVPPGSETHYKLVIVDDAFRGKALVARHRLINGLLADEFGKGLHALAIQAFTTEEWNARQGLAATSPPCRGGSKAG